VCGGGLASLAGPRAVFVAGGVGVLCACIWSVRSLRGEWVDQPEPAQAHVNQAAAAAA
jgi:hypothetical protein